MIYINKKKLKERLDALEAFQPSQGFLSVYSNADYQTLLNLFNEAKNICSNLAQQNLEYESSLNNNSQIFFGMSEQINKLSSQINELSKELNLNQNKLKEQDKNLKYTKSLLIRLEKEKLNFFETTKNKALTQALEESAQIRKNQLEQKEAKHQRDRQQLSDQIKTLKKKLNDLTHGYNRVKDRRMIFPRPPKGSVINRVQ